MNLDEETDDFAATLAKQEIKSQATILRKAIGEIQSLPTSKASIAYAIQSSEILLELVKKCDLRFLNELIQQVLEYFKMLRSGMLFQNLHLEILSKVIGVLFYLADTKVGKIQKMTSSEFLEFDQLSEKLKKIINEYKTQQSGVVGKESEKKDSDEKKEFLKNEKSSFQESLVDTTMLELFDHELESQCKILNQGLIELEQKPENQKVIESLLRAAHSIKGAARVVNLDPIVQLAHLIEDYLTNVRNLKINIPSYQIDHLLRGVDFLSQLSKVNLSQLNQWLRDQASNLESLREEIKRSLLSSIPEMKRESIETKEEFGPSELIPRETLKKDGLKKIETRKVFQKTLDQDRVLRITAQNLNYLMGLSGELLVESRWLQPFEENLQNFKVSLRELSTILEKLRENAGSENLNQILEKCLKDFDHKLNEIRLQFTDRLNDLDSFIRRHASLSDRLYQEVINSRMRPFADGVEGFPRMVRDLAHQLGKRVRLEIEGKSTLVDRDILEILESPISHLLRNAVDHGIEFPDERKALGKPLEGVIKLTASHKGGMLALTVSDDGKGIDISQLRRRVIESKLVNEELAQKLSDSEILDFLFLPGFSTSSAVTEISGRGMGLNVVQNAVQEVGGVVQTILEKGKGLVFHLQLPLTLAVVRALLVEISGEIYAFPLARIDKAFLVNNHDIEMIENKQFFRYEGHNIGLISAWQILELKESQFNPQHLPIVVISERLNSYGIVVDRLIGEKELVVQELDPRLGKIPDIVAGALLEDGSPVLIIDVEDIILSINHILSGGPLKKVSSTQKLKQDLPRKRILIVDDSITVREFECRLLQNAGFEVEAAANGVDGWNAARIGYYDLVITDIDMPRMNGIELLKAIKNDPRLSHLPVMIVSYKQSDENKEQGLQAGADYYLTKKSFDDESLLEAVTKLIGHSD